MPRGGVEKERIGRGPRERCRSVPQGGVKKKKKTERSVADRESSIALCYGVALKKKKEKKMIGRGPRERCIAIPRFGINNALQGRKERNSKGVWEGAESRSLGTDAHSSVLHTVGQRNVMAELCFKAGHIYHTCPEERAQEAWLS